MMLPKVNLELAKLTLHVEQQPFKPIPVLFNPNEIKIVQTVWETKGQGELVPADIPKTLEVTLFFDTSLPQPTTEGLVQTLAQASLGRSLGLPSGHQPSDVRDETRKITQLAEPQIAWKNGKRPPICQLHWGKWGGTQRNDGFFQGVLEAVTQTFSRFLADGTPVRAQLVCTFREWEDPEYAAKKRNEVDDPIRIVRRGETLSSIAQEEYGDPALWRVIADENHLMHPRQLQPGQQLTVPPLRHRRMRP